MGTRCLTIIKDESSEITVLYRQMDGYPDGHGSELAEFLDGLQLVNGIPGGRDTSSRIANGMDCLAAQIVAHFKTGVGSFYLYPAGTRDCGEEYRYIVHEGLNHKIHVAVTETRGSIETALFNGTPSEMLTWIDSLDNN